MSNKSGKPDTEATDLLVPFDEKDEAKKLGARWNPQKKLWYVPKELNVAPFKKWLPPTPKANGQYEDKPNVRSKGFWVAEGVSDRICWKCKEATSVFAFLVPAEHEILNEDGGDKHGQWEKAGYEQFLSNVTYLGENAVKAIREHGEEYRIDYHHGYYWLNHCEECDALLSDWYDHCEPDGSFTLDPEEAEGRVTVYYYDLPFEATVR